MDKCQAQLDFYTVRFVHLPPPPILDQPKSRLSHWADFLMRSQSAHKHFYQLKLVCNGRQLVAVQKFYSSLTKELIWI
jgi:hypothetical protein